MLKCYVKGKNLINGVEKQFNISEGAVFTENYNETLDSGTIILPQLIEEIEIEPYDVVVIFSTQDSKCKIKQRIMCVDTFVCTQTSLDPAIYKYEISLFSETKLLEGILLPSLAITRKISNPRSVLDYLEYYLDQYGTKTNSNVHGANTPRYRFSNRVNNKFYNIECPELQWNEPNLREVLNDLMMVGNCIAVVKNNVIDYIDISRTGSEITANQRKGINYIQKSQSSQDYVSEIKTRIQNSVGEDEKTNICENITFRNFETYLLTTENVKVETTFPIWKLKKVSINIYANIDITINQVATQISHPTYINNYKTNYLATNIYYDDSQNIKNILEYGEWLTKDIFYAGQGASMAYSTNYQNTCLYYTRGERGIFNFNAKQEKIGFFWVPYTISVLEMIKNTLINGVYREVVDEFLKENPLYNVPTLYDVTASINNADWKRIVFEVEYETVGDYTLFASKMPIPTNKRQIVDNQTNSYVNAKTFGMLEYMKANRLGNKLKLINGRYADDEVNIPALAQKVDNSIIFKKEIAVYENFIKANYQATDNYVLRDYFTGIKAKLRSWRILSGNETFIRNDNIKFYINSNISSINDIYYKIPVYSTLQEYMSKFNYCVVKFQIDEGVYFPNGNEIKYKNTNYGVDGYMMEFQKIICGNSVLFSIKAFDNAIIGKYVADNEYDIGDNIKTMTQKNCKYVNEDGENLGGIIYFYENYSLEGKTGDVPDALNNLLPAVATSGRYSGLSNLVARIPFTFRKDNKEITQITIQFEMNEYANDMFLGKK